MKYDLRFAAEIDFPNRHCDNIIVKIIFIGSKIVSG